jgi:hypothetical protein
MSQCELVFEISEVIAKVEMYIFDKKWTKRSRQAKTPSHFAALIEKLTESMSAHSEIHRRNQSLKFHVDQ